MITYTERVLELEKEGAPTTDAQAAADVEATYGKLLCDHCEEATAGSKLAREYGIYNLCDRCAVQKIT